MQIELSATHMRSAIGEDPYLNFKNLNRMRTVIRVADLFAVPFE